MPNPPNPTRSHRAPTALPQVTPLILKRLAEAFDHADWLFELKYDGFRALLEIDKAGARLVSRNRNRFRHLDPLAAALAKRLRVTNAVLDGEVCCADETGRPIFLDLLRRKGPCFEHNLRGLAVPGWQWWDRKCSPDVEC
jgi:bifunctional non-homologous end joining protein LigD